MIENLFDLVFVGLGRPLRHFLEQLVLATLRQMLKLAFKVIGVQGHFVIPSTVFEDEALRLPLEALHALLDHGFENC